MRRRGVTIVEIIVVVGVITVMLGLLLPVAGSVRTHGRKVREMSAARQLMVAYFNYAADHRDAVLPGYKLGSRARDHRGHAVGDPAAARYPWRLAPYIDFALHGLFVDSQRELLAELEQTDPDTYVYGISLNPSLGLNATWVGGNERELGFNRTFEDLFGPFYVRHCGEILHPERLLIFVSARGEDPMGSGLGPVEGYFRTASPWLTVVEGDRWSQEYESGGDPVDFGHVSLRYGGVAVIAYADGHTGELDERRLRDMRHWANWAQTADYALTPR